jgi:Glycosyl hydrolases family 38 C-terminal domain
VSLKKAMKGKVDDEQDTISDVFPFIPPPPPPRGDFRTVSRPTHRNTTWDRAKFEVCGHKFADLSEFGYGVALINDCKYGYAVEGALQSSCPLRPRLPFLESTFLTTC